MPRFALLCALALAAAPAFAQADLTSAHWASKTVEQRGDAVVREVSSIANAARQLTPRLRDAVTIANKLDSGYFGSGIKPGTKKCVGLNPPIFSDLQFGAPKAAKDVTTAKAALTALKRSKDWAAFKAKLGILPGVKTLGEACLKLSKMPAECKPNHREVSPSSMQMANAGMVKSGVAAVQVTDICAAGGESVSVLWRRLSAILATNAPPAAAAAKGNGKARAKPASSAPARPSTPAPATPPAKKGKK